MDDEARARAATRGAVDDIAPPGLHEVIDARLEQADTAPGVLTLLSARASGGTIDDAVERRAAAVQLIYDGLALTRGLARSPPWPDGDDVGTADVEILAADVLVGRGFYLLARTDAAPLAVETVRSFGRDETERRDGTGGHDRSLEEDVFELAIVAGATAVGVDPPAGSQSFARDLAASFEPGRRVLKRDPTVAALDELLSEDGAVAPSPDRVWAGSATD